MKYIYSKDGLIYVECEICKKQMKFRETDIGEIGQGVECFCGNVSSNILGMPKKEVAVTKTVQKTPEPIVQTIYVKQESQVQQPQGPRCPTCGSADIQKISLASKAVGGYMFGILSSNIRNTFKCNSCGYKW